MSSRIPWPASMLLKLACRLMPRERGEWAEAMKAEIHYLPRGAVFSWAAGCLVTAIKQRFAPVHTGNFRINRWVFLVETLGCFGPATLAWWEFTFGPSGAAYFSRKTFAMHFESVSPAFQYATGLHLGHALTGVVAPMGLFLGLRYVIRNRALDNRALGCALITAPVLQTIAGFIGVVGFGVQPLLPGLFLLLIVLPIAGFVHLMYLAWPAAFLPTGTRLAAG